MKDQRQLGGFTDRLRSFKLSHTPEPSRFPGAVTSFDYAQVVLPVCGSQCCICVASCLWLQFSIKLTPINRHIEPRWEELQHNSIIQCIPSAVHMCFWIVMILKQVSQMCSCLQWSHKTGRLSSQSSPSKHQTGIEEKLKHKNQEAEA